MINLEHSQLHENPRLSKHRWWTAILSLDIRDLQFGLHVFGSDSSKLNSLCSTRCFQKYEVESKYSVSQHGYEVGLLRSIWPESADYWCQYNVVNCSFHCLGMPTHCEIAPSVADMACKEASMSMKIPQKLVQRVCVWYSMQQGLTAADTCQQITQVFGQQAYSDRSIFRWHKDFSGGRTKLGDLFRRGGPKLARNATMIAQCRRKVERNRHVTVDHLSHSMGISHGSVVSILHKDLHLSKRAAKLVPHVLTPRQRQNRVDFCQNFLREYRGRPDILAKIITCDESYFHVYDPLSKQESREWLTRDMNQPQVVRKEQSTKKVMFLPFLTIAVSSTLSSSTT